MTDSSLGRMSKASRFSSKQKILLIFSFSIFYQIFLAIVLAHVFQTKGLLYSVGKSWPNAVFSIILHFVPVVRAFFKLPIHPSQKRATVAALLSIAYIIVTPPAIFLSGAALKSDVKKVNTEELCFSIKSKWQDGRWSSPRKSCHLQ